MQKLYISIRAKYNKTKRTYSQVVHQTSSAGPFQNVYLLCLYYNSRTLHNEATAWCYKSFLGYDNMHVMFILLYNLALTSSYSTLAWCNSLPRLHSVRSSQMVVGHEPLKQHEYHTDSSIILRHLDRYQCLSQETALRLRTGCKRT